MEKMLIASLITMLLTIVYLAVQNTMLRVQHRTQKETLTTMYGRLPSGRLPEKPSERLPIGLGLLWIIPLLGGLALLLWLLFRTF